MIILNKRVEFTNTYPDSTYPFDQASMVRDGGGGKFLKAELYAVFVFRLDINEKYAAADRRFQEE